MWPLVSFAAIRDALGFAGPAVFLRSQNLGISGPAQTTAPKAKRGILQQMEPGDNLLSLRKALSQDRAQALHRRQYRLAFSIEKDIQAVTHAILGAR